MLMVLPNKLTTPLLMTGAPGWLGDVVLAQLAAGGMDSQARLACLIQASMPPERHASHAEVTTLFRGDMRDFASLAQAVPFAAGGVLLHGAGLIHPRRTQEWYTINRDGTLKLAQLAKAAGVRRFVYISSNAAQGVAPAADVLLTEEMPCRPLSHYGRSKYEAEQGLMALHEAGRFDVVIARPCMFYGPPVPSRHVDIFKRIQRGRLPLVGGGKYARSLSYIDDLARGVILCLLHPDAAGQIFNLCDSQPSTTQQICEAMAAALNVPPRFIPLPGFSASLAYGVDRLLASVGVYSSNFHLLGEANWNVGNSNEKARRILGYQSTVDVFEGYRRAVAWCRERKLLD